MECGQAEMRPHLWEGEVTVKQVVIPIAFTRVNNVHCTLNDEVPTAAHHPARVEQILVFVRPVSCGFPVASPAVPVVILR